MKLPLLVFSLIVVYWTCISYADEDINSTRDLINLDEDYTSDYQDVPWERPLSRNKRGLIMNPVTKLVLKGMGKSAGGMVKIVLKPVLDLCGFGYGALIGKKVCPKVGDISLLKLLSQITLRPISTIETVMCIILDKIGSTGRAMILKGIEASIKFGRKVVAPTTCTVLKKLRDTGYLPQSINAMIDAVHASCKIMKMLGIIG
ncbi:uncharacterized protein LOC116852047 [Odontomachus brunneus]|uniref:uncharacterized protein LOC116852047 n=1 Tax=Odontomachus brunneus TaxID=486640 RepID=UPI0013F1C626|nr:uncharacterized protein LOC116852047 [Odontomachus brunneus]